MYSKVKFVEGFKDGNIFGSREFAPGDTAVLTEAQLAQVRNSGGVVEVVEQVIRNPLKDEKLAAEEQKAMPDPLNPENSINKPGHIPGLEDEVEEVREREANRKQDKKRK